MANDFWNFRPSDEQQKAAFIARQRADMQGYAPAPDMAGYRPTFGGRQVNPGFVPATQPQLQQQQEHTAYDNSVQALQDEYNRNNARIAEIEQELRTIAVSDRKAIDDLDLALAQNRSDIGDIGTAYMHLGRIDQRRAAELGKSTNTDTDRNAAEDEIDRLYIQRADASPSQQVYIDRAIERKEAAYQKTYGKPYGGKLEVPTGAQSASDVTTFQGYDDVLQQELNANGNNGRLSKAQIAKLGDILETLPRGDERNSRKKALDAIVSNEKHAEDTKKEKARINDAIDEARNEYAKTWKLTNGGPSATYTARNGKQVTISKNNGKIRYAIGKTYKEF